MKTKQRVGFCWIFGAFCFALSSLLLANTDQQMKEDFGRVKSGSLFLSGQQRKQFAPMLNTDVQLQVTGMIVRATVTQHFQNPGSEWVEGTYLFPLPNDAAVDHMRLRIGERIIEGVIKEKTEARRAYRQAKREGKRASLLTQQRPNLFTVSVANIGPNETVRVEIEYQHTVRLDSGEFSLRFPMTLTPRYIPGQPLLDEHGLPQRTGPGASPNTGQVLDASHITPSFGRNGENSNPINITVDLMSGFALSELESLHHQIDQQKTDRQRYRVSLNSTEHDANRDFVLRWRAAVASEPYVGTYTQKWRDAYYSLLMVTPQMETPSNPGESVLPRDLVFVIDTSGSMGGESIRQAKRALVMAIKRLQPQDRFNLIQFNSNTRSLFPDVQPATQAMRARAISYAKALSAGGGTEMYSAIDSALTQRYAALETGQPERLRQIVFLTDGAVGNEQQLFELIKQKLDNSRLFTIGIGSAPNSYFMSKAAEFGRGSFTHIGSMKMVAERMTGLFRKLEAPVLTGLEVELPQTGMVELYPQRIPDLYQGEPVVVAIKTEKRPQQLFLSGGSAAGEFQRTLDLHRSEQRDGVNVLWARRKTAALIDQYPVTYEPHKKEALKQAVIDLSLEHHLVSRFTSLVAVDKTPARRPSEPLSEHRLKNNRPAGSQFGLPQTATDGMLHIIIGLAVGLLGLLLRVRLNPSARHEW